MTFLENEFDDSFQVELIVTDCMENFDGVSESNDSVEIAADAVNISGREACQGKTIITWVNRGNHSVILWASKIEIMEASALHMVINQVDR